MIWCVCDFDVCVGEGSGGEKDDRYVNSYNVCGFTGGSHGKRGRNVLISAAGKEKDLGPKLSVSVEPGVSFVPFP